MGGFDRCHPMCHHTHRSSQTNAEPDHGLYVCSGVLQSLSPASLLLCVPRLLALPIFLYRFAMPRRTRQGTQFSPFEGFLDGTDLNHSPYRVIHSPVDLQELLAAAQAASDARTELPDNAEDESDWEDVESRAPSPISRSPSPEESSLPTPPIPGTPATTVADDEDLPERDMPALLPSADQRCAARQAQAASPFTCAPHPKALPTHRILPAHKLSQFDAAALKSSGGGAWIGCNPSPSGPKKKKTKGKCQTNCFKTLRLCELQELMEMGYPYIVWDGLSPLLIVDRKGRIIAAFIWTPEDPE
ncbi:hypothetical protein B0H17DRAFT_692050 [Mycena rosella]|uniref:Uncharacterized protein n=1 Tax=Mycena rosella TaxID=1033263 RepID=A0AAD7DAV1_MYCRO|nr:hypothetical protein B0H17DRAFT_692050 [Mycena rosella]